MRDFRSNPICGPPWRSSFLGAAALLVACSVLATAALADWVDFDDQTAPRIVAGPGLGSDDTQEKDFAWGDVDQDGDIDLVVVRKQPFTSAGKFPNVLFINEDGVLTDRTAEFATESDIPGDSGFHTPTNDRDVTLVDVDLDGWLDIVTGPAISIDDPKHIGHPRIYMNKGCTGGCNGTDDWQGFRYEDARIPAMLSDSGQPGFNPCLCAVVGGDVTGDGYPELWLIDYDSGCGQAGADFNNKLLLNQGASNPGFFVDVTETSFSKNFQDSAFGASGAVEDMNGDGVTDLVKQFAGTTEIAFNNPDDEGFFDRYTSPYGGATYFMSIGNLNNDSKLDVVISDDGQDRYVLNQGNDGNGVAQFISFAFSYSHSGPGGNSGDDGFSGNNITADLDQDGWDDVLIADVDVDVSGCRGACTSTATSAASWAATSSCRSSMGTSCENLFGNPASCIVASIPSDKLEGVHDVAVFDVNGDGWDDLVVGRCAGTEVYVNMPPGLPAGGLLEGDAGPGSQLILGKGALNQIQLSWGESCALDDTDYAIYVGRLDEIGEHSSVTCSTGGATTQSVLAPLESSYYLVVPHNGIFEGSYGARSNGTQRVQGNPSCRAQNLGACD